MSTAEGSRCSSCDRAVEVCCFCERDACDRMVCYRCLVISLREFVPQPHAHGG
ncbi:MAG: hypothetical protein ACRDH1_05435 [Actinomycetota bacterium]